MSSQRYDDDFFITKRERLLQPRLPPTEGYLCRLSAGVPRGSAQEDQAEKDTENALEKLAPRHSAALRAHMALYQAALESTGLIPAHALVQAAVQIEWMWYTSPFKSFYRDHLAHVMKVTAIADDLVTSRTNPLKNSAKPGKTLGDQIAGRLVQRKTAPILHRAALRLGVSPEDLKTTKFWKESMCEALKIAGLLHDMAYQGKMSRMVRKVSGAADPLAPLAPDTQRDLDKIFDLIDGTLVGAVFNRDSDDPLDRIRLAPVLLKILEKSHSLQAGAAILHYGQVADRAWRLTPQEAFAIEWAARAATLHDFDKIYFYVTGAKPDEKADAEKSPLGQWLAAGGPPKTNGDFLRPSYDSDPVSYLLAFADQLQDFGRLHYSVTKGASDATTFEISYPCKKVELERLSAGSLAIRWDHTWEENETGPFGLKDPLVDGPKKGVDQKLEDAIKVFVKAKNAPSWLDHGTLLSRVQVDVPRAVIPTWFVPE